MAVMRRRVHFDRAANVPVVQVAILANHQNGRDTHIRQIKVFTPRRHMGQHMCLPEFNTMAFHQYACLR